MKYLIVFLLVFFSAVSLSHARKAMVWGAEGKVPENWPACVQTVRMIPGTSIYRVDYPEASGCLTALSQMEHIVYIEEDETLIMADEFSASAGDLHTCGSLANIDLLADLGLGKDVLVAVIDSGIAVSNFGAVIAVNQAETPWDGVDNDQNGYADDYYGWDFGDMDSDPADEQGHGTQVSSIVLSIAPEISLLPIKVNSGASLTFSTGDAAEAIFYAISRGADILNLSFSTASYSLAIFSAVTQALNSGILVVAAAGNDGTTDVQFPASMDGVIAVGSHDSNGDPSYFSPSGGAMDILGLGESVCATNMDGAEVSVSGTSFSAPAITGAAAVLLSMNPHLGISSLELLLFAGTLDILDTGWDIHSGFGNLDTGILVAAATPSVVAPDQVLKGEILSIDLDLPPTDIDTEVYFAVVYENNVWWMDSTGYWFNAGVVNYQPFTSLVLSSFSTQKIYGQSGSYDAIDTAPHLTGKYLWGTGIFDKNGKLLAPIGWKEMTLYE